MVVGRWRGGKLGFRERVALQGRFLPNGAMPLVETNVIVHMGCLATD